MRNIAIALMLIALGGCASVVNDKNQKVLISASNGQAIKGTIQEEKIKTEKVKVDGKVKAKKTTTQEVAASFDGQPADVLLVRSNAKKVVVVDNAECQKETPIKTSVSPMFFGNILIGGLVGSTTDAATGKMWQYQENVVVECK